MNRNIIASEQLELGFNGRARCNARRRPLTRIERAAWWFARMRTAVDAAMTWSGKPERDPEQMEFAR